MVAILVLTFANTGTSECTSRTTSPLQRLADTDAFQPG